jgi:hypothetical protein
LKEPGDYGIRLADESHVKKLEDEILDNPLLELQSPIVVMVDPNSGDPADFSIETQRCYNFLVISGNHRRQALLNIKSDKARRKLLPKGFDTVKVHVYSGKVLIKLMIFSRNFICSVIHAKG